MDPGHLAGDCCACLPSIPNGWGLRFFFFFFFFFFIFFFFYWLWGFGFCVFFGFFGEQTVLTFKGGR